MITESQAFELLRAEVLRAGRSFVGLSHGEKIAVCVRAIQKASSSAPIVSPEEPQNYLHWLGIEAESAG